jgi:hypothetical protein
MTNEAIEAAARAIKSELGRQFNAQPIHPDPAVDDWSATGGEINLTDLALAAAPALMEEGARLALEAAAELITPGRIEHSHHAKCSCVYCEGWRDVHAIQALDPAAIVKGASNDRD